MFRQRWFQAGWPPLVAVILLLFIWQLAVTWGHVESWLLPSPLQIAAEAWESGHRVWLHTQATIQVALIGFAAGAAVGILLACALHLAPLLKSAVQPLLILSQNIPIIALGPLLMICFGYGMFPKIVLITLVCFFPICMSLLDGFRQTDRTMLDYMRMAGASKRQLFAKLELPYALPFLFSGLKLSATYSVMGAIIAEWLGSGQGLGYYMTLQKASYRADRMFVAILVVAALSLLFFALIAWLEKRVVRWNAKR